MVRFFYVKYLKCKFLSGSRGPHRPDLSSPSGRKFQFSLRFTLCQMMGEVSTETSPTETNWFKTRQNCSFRTFYNMKYVQFDRRRVNLDFDT